MSVVKSRRKAREAAMRVLYEIELGQAEPEEALQLALENAELPEDLAEYTRWLVRTTYKNRKMIDQRITNRLKDFGLERLAAVDRNVMRVATCEFLFDESIPPAVSINEAIEIVRKYSTVESGKFVNGVLGKLLLETPKVKWDPATAPPEFAESPAEAEEIEVIEEDLSADSPEAERLARIGGWKLRTPETQSSEEPK